MFVLCFRFKQKFSFNPTIRGELLKPTLNKIGTIGIPKPKQIGTIGIPKPKLIVTNTKKIPRLFLSPNQSYVKKLGQNGLHTGIYRGGH